MVKTSAAVGVKIENLKVVQRQLEQELAKLQAEQQAYAAHIALRGKRKQEGAALMAVRLGGSDRVGDRMVATWYRHKAAVLALRAAPPKVVAPTNGGQTAAAVNRLAYRKYTRDQLLAALPFAKEVSTPDVHRALDPASGPGNWAGGTTVPSMLHALRAAGVVHLANKGGTNYWTKLVR